MSGFVIQLGVDGVYTKQGGPALQPRQPVLLNQGVFELPQYCEESRGEVLVAREWRIPFGFGHFLVREFLPVAEAPKAGWPW
ncbi:hypothetical protein [Burkholderia sp. JKS000303]|uniref:hypothetical protein n=1 Tax=Burkholderia sp. JKS000303 TaxID=1938747 RepID=UPI000BF3EE17|nr:hypothetical protein [Burkholderia sp. JKS000303]PFH29119.1 hypothetical protein BX604_2891 [Burkholderia sp. JKS000303]